MKGPEPVVDPAVLDAWARGLTPPPVLTVSEYAAQSRVLVGRSSASPGPWDNAVTPYLVEIMDRLSESDPAQVVVFQKGSQIGGTEAGNNWVAYSIDHAPGPMMFVMPAIDDVRNSSKSRIDSLIETNPRLRELVAEPRSRDGGNTRLSKLFPGGELRMVGAKTARALKSMPAGKLFFDEVDEYDADVDGQGDPVELVRVRSRTYSGRRKEYLVSSPTLRGSSRIEREFKEGDQRRYHVPCPHCGVYQLIEWSRIQWQSTDEGEVVAGTVRLQCEACEQPIEEAHKHEMLAAGEWQATATGKPGVVSYHLSALYSPLSWYSWEEAARDFVKARKLQKEYRDPSLMKVFTNTVLGETWGEDDPTAGISWVQLQERGEPYEPLTVPLRARFLTAGVDTQDDRLAVSIYGWEAGGERWLIWHEELYGDPDHEDVWKLLDQLIDRQYTRDDGRELRIVSVGIDSGGHRTHAVYDYCRRRRLIDRSERVFALRGANKYGAPVVGRPTHVDINFKGKTIKSGVKLWPIGTDGVKAVLRRQLSFTEHGPGYHHTYEGAPDEYFQQLLGEKRVTQRIRGVPREVWVKTHKAVEAWDNLVYAYAAAVRYGLKRLKPRPIHELPEALKIKPIPPPQPTNSTPTPANVGAPRYPPPAKPASRKKKRRRWVGPFG